MSSKQILITGANDGIGLALAKQLTKDYGAKVFLGSRSKARGLKAVEEVKAHNSAGSSDVELVIIDVNSQDSIDAAVEKLKKDNVRLYGLVNNAGIGFNADYSDEFIINTNYFGTKRVTEAFMPLLEEDGRIIMTGSGAGPMTVRNMPPELQKKFVFPDESIMEELEGKMKAGELKQYCNFSGYGVSKCMMHMYAMTLAKAYPKYRSYAVNPGFINTKMARQFNPSLTPEAGTKSLRHCLFNATKEQSGWYFGSDAERSPIHATRNPGDPVFDGVYPF